MKPKTLILMGVAIACGLGASYMTSRLLAERRVDDSETVTVLVAKKGLHIGDTIKVPEDLFQPKVFLKGEEPKNAISELDLLRSRIVKRPLRTGDFVTIDDLIGDKDGDFMNVKLAPGYRAVGVRVNVESSAYGFASLPLARVDIISTVRRGDDKATYSQVLLENVLVLAADDKTQRDESGKPMPSQVVTLALKPDEALKVALASELGSLRLMLRKINDPSKVEHSKLTYEGLKSGDDDRGASEDPDVHSDPAVPVAKTPKQEPKEVSLAEVKAPQVADAKASGKNHRLWITEGEHTRHQRFRLGDHNEVLLPDEAQDAQPPRLRVEGQPTPPKQNDEP